METDLVVEKSKVFNQPVILAYLEGPIYDFTNCLLEVNNPVPVKNDENKTIGFGMVQIKNGKLIADLAIDYHTPERLSAEIQDGVPYWAHVTGKLSLCKSYNLSNMLDFFGAKQTVSIIAISSVVLSTQKPKDHRIQPFKEVIVL